jgi:4-amino-4-deoxy-L-arabinose transferase-like glycosyltransferase
MSGTGFGILFGAIYLVLIVTIGVITFRKGHWVLGLIGFIFPILWLVGAILPPKRRYR